MDNPIPVYRKRTGTIKMVPGMRSTSWICEMFLIGYGAVAGFNVGDEKPPHFTRVSKNRTVARVMIGIVEGEERRVRQV
jgi:hypothetical protein